MESNGIHDSLKYHDYSLWWFYEAEFIRLSRYYILDKKNMNRTIADHKIIYYLKIRFGKLFFILKSIVRAIVGKSLAPFNKSIHNVSSNSKICVFSYSHYWKNYPVSQQTDSEIKKYGDSIMGSVISKLNNNNIDVLALDVDTSPFIDFHTLFEKNACVENCWRPIEYYLSRSNIFKSLQLLSNHKREWDSLCSDDQFIDSLDVNFDGISTKDFFMTYLSKLFNYQSLNSLLYLLLAQRIVEIESPDMILMSYGPVPLARAVALIGKINQIPVLELQHGIIHPYHVYYVHPKKMRLQRDEHKSLFHSLPDVTCVYGDVSKNILVENSVYEKDDVIVTGQPRYDVLCDMDQSYSKTHFCHVHDIDEHKKILFWATQCHGIRDDENIRNLDSVFNSMTKLDGFTLVIKQHPSEGKEYSDLIQSYIDKYDVDVLFLPKNYDTYEVLYVCDVLMVKDSTSAMEAIAIDKPVIVLHLSDDINVTDYVEKGVAVGVYDEDGLVHVLENISTIDLFLSANKATYVEDVLYKIDGKSTDRVIKVIQKMLNRE